MNSEPLGLRAPENDEACRVGGFAESVTSLTRQVGVQRVVPGDGALPGARCGDCAGHVDRQRAAAHRATSLGEVERGDAAARIGRVARGACCTELNSPVDYRPTPAALAHLDIAGGGIHGKDLLNARHRLGAAGPKIPAGECDALGAPPCAEEWRGRVTTSNENQHPPDFGHSQILGALVVRPKLRSLSREQTTYANPVGTGLASGPPLSGPRLSRGET